MNAKLLFQDSATFPTPLLAVFAVDISTGKDEEAHPALLTTSDAIAKAAAPWISSGEFKATVGETLLLHSPAGVKAERLLIVGLGKAKSLTVHEVRKGAGVAVRFVKPRALRELAIAFPEDKALSDEHMDSLPCDLTARAIAEGAILAEFDIDIYRSDRKDLSVHAVSIVAREADKKSQAEMQHGFDRGLIIAESQNFARSLVNEPGNVLTPTELGNRTAAMCAEFGLQCEVHSWDKINELKMGALAAVAQGSVEPPALIVMRYQPSNASPDGPVLGLIGKGITFDTGGISIKPADNMEKMKYDMAGAAAMIGAMRAIAQLKPAVRVLAIVCSAENMPDGKAFKPGDVITAMSGKTIEIINTDAEGRLVLADVLYYVNKRFKPKFMINLATLTGAIIVALGQEYAGLFSNDDKLSERLAKAGEATGERVWRMPLAAEYDKIIDSKFADVKNSGGRFAGSITAAQFLQRFVNKTPWAHLDIAGTALGSPQSEINKSWSSGWGVRLLNNLVEENYES